MSSHTLYLPHPSTLTVLHHDLENHALSCLEVLIGTPGSVMERENAQGFRFYSRQFYLPNGKKRELYLGGPVGDPEADDYAYRTRAQINETKALIRDIRLLGREGYQLADAYTYSTLATLHNHGLFRAGLTLVGSHAFGALLNHLGVRATSYKTEDVDVARAEPLTFDTPPQAPLFEILKSSGVEFVEVPSFKRGEPSTSWKELGRGRFQVDLLVPSPNDEFKVVPVPELKAHAQSIPYLRYLLGETQRSLLIAREGCFSILTPTPERFALHKLLVSQLRGAGALKGRKDLTQAATLLAVLSERSPGAITDAFERLPLSAITSVKAAIIALSELLGDTHPRVWDELSRP